MIGFNRGFGWKPVRTFGVRGGTPPLNGLVQWLLGPTLIDQINLVSLPTIVSGVITQTDPNMAFSNFWSADGVALDVKSVVNQTGWISGNGYVWFYSDGGAVTDVLTYDHTLEVAEYKQLKKYLLGSDNTIIKPVYDIDNLVVRTAEIWNDLSIWYDLLMWNETPVLYAQP